MNKKISFLMIVLCFVGISHAQVLDNPGVGGGFEGEMGLSASIATSMPDSQTAMSMSVPKKSAIKKTGKKNAKAAKQAKVAQTYEEFVEQRTKNQPNLPTKEEFATLVEQAKVHESLEKALLNMNYADFKTALQSATKLDIGTDMKKAVKKLKIPPQGKFKKLALAKIAQQALKSALENGDYNAFTATFANKEKVPSQEDFIKLSAATKKHAATQQALLENNYALFTIARKAEQPKLPSKEEFEAMQQKKQ